MLISTVINCSHDWQKTRTMNLQVVGPKISQAATCQGPTAFRNQTLTLEAASGVPKMGVPLLTPRNSLESP